MRGGSGSNPLLQTSSNQPSCPAAPGSSTTQLSLGSSSTQLLLAPASCYWFHYTSHLLLIPLYQSAAAGSSTTQLFQVPLPPSFSCFLYKQLLLVPLPHQRLLVPLLHQRLLVPLNHHCHQRLLVPLPKLLPTMQLHWFLDPANCFWFLYQQAASGSFTSFYWFLYQPAAPTTQLVLVPLPAAFGSFTSCYWFL